MSMYEDGALLRRVKSLEDGRMTLGGAIIIAMLGAIFAAALALVALSKGGEWLCSNVDDNVKRCIVTEVVPRRPAQ